MRRVFLACLELLVLMKKMKNLLVNAFLGLLLLNGTTQAADSPERIPGLMWIYSETDVLKILSSGKNYSRYFLSVCPTFMYKTELLNRCRIMWGSFLYAGDPRLIKLGDPELLKGFVTFLSTKLAPEVKRDFNNLRHPVFTRNPTSFGLQFQLWLEEEKVDDVYIEKFFPAGLTFKGDPYLPSLYNFLSYLGGEDHMEHCLKTKEFNINRSPSLPSFLRGCYPDFCD